MAVRLAAEKRESLMGSLIVLTTLRRRNPVLRPQCWIRDDFNLNIAGMKTLKVLKRSHFKNSTSRNSKLHPFTFSTNVISTNVIS